MHIINRESQGNWLNGAIKGGRKYKGLEYLRGSIPLALYNAGISVSGDRAFWTGDVTIGKYAGKSRAETWQNHFKHDLLNDTNVYRLLGTAPSPSDTLQTIQARQNLLTLEVRWIKDHLL